MALNFVITIVKEKSLKIPRFKKIYNNYKLYYHYKQNRPNVIIETHLNKITTLQLN